MKNLPLLTLCFVLSVLLLRPLSSVQAQAPSNDNCASAITLTPGATCSAISGTTLGATQSVPAVNCNGNVSVAAEDVWYKFTATATSQTVTVMSNGLFDAVIDVRSGACNGVSIACSDQYGNGSMERLPLTGLTIGSVYYVRVYHNGASDPSRVNFTICVENPPVNDECTNAITLTSATVCNPITGTTINATQSLAGITCAGITSIADDDVWYKFTAVAPYQTVTVNGNDTFNAVIDVRSGTCNGTSIACADATVGHGTETVDLSGLTVGSTYFVRVYSRGNEYNSPGTFTICVTYSIPPNNDCANAITLTSNASCAAVEGTTKNASQSLAAITCGGITGTADDDVWYKFTARANNYVLRVVGGVGFNPVVDVRSGACNGANLACADATASGGTETVNLSGLTVGNTYFVRVYSRGGNTTDQGTFTICLIHTPPVNDECANAITLTLGNTCTPTAGTTVHASESLPSITCGQLVGSSDDDVWYKFTAVATSHRVSVTGIAGFQAFLDVRSGSCTGTSIGCAGGSSGNTQNALLTGLTIGATYFVRVFSFSSGTQYQGNFTICVTIPPANDECVNAVTLTPSTSCNPITGTNLNATKSINPIVCSGQTGLSNDVWYKFTAVATAHRVTVVGTAGLKTGIDVRSGTCNTNNSIGCNPGITSGNVETLVVSGLTIGNTYFVRIYSSFAGEGEFTICVLTPPANDECANATALTSGATCTPTSGTTINATESLGAISCGPIPGDADDDVWYKFTALATNHTVKVVGQAGFNPVLDVRTGICNGTNIACADNPGDEETLDLTGLTIGNTYFVRVYSLYQSSGTFTICVTHSPPSNDNCLSAATLTSGATCTPTLGTTLTATQSMAAITCGATTGTADDDVWYKFTAVNATHTVRVVGDAGFNAVVDVRTGICNGTTIACADATTSGTETVNLTGLTYGTTYFVRVYSRGSVFSDRGTFNICVTHTSVTNNECANAVTINAGISCSPTIGTTVGASQSIAAITCGATTGTADDDVWYKFIANNTSHTISVAGDADFNAVVDVRTGTCNGTSFACADATTSGTETVNLTGLTVGNTYFIRVYSFGSATADRGNFTICVSTAPLNDECANAFTLTSDIICPNIYGTTLNATESLPAIDCTNGASGTAANDVWYKFTAVSTVHRVSVLPLGFQAVLDIRAGACNGTSIACDDDADFTGAVNVNLTGLTIGNTYYIRVYSYLDFFQGDFLICLTHPITNDNCVNATTLTSNTFCSPTTGMTFEATQSLAAINCNGTGVADDDVWYKFTAVATAHTVKVETTDIGFDAVVDVRTGSCNGTSIACADATTDGGTETVNLTGLTVGNTYFVRVYSKAGDMNRRGIFSICITHPCLPSLTVSESITGGTLVKEAIRITANNQITGGIVTYRVGQSVTLQPGFSVISSAGNRFQAITGGCP